MKQRADKINSPTISRVFVDLFTEHAQLFANGLVIIIFKWKIHCSLLTWNVSERNALWLLQIISSRFIAVCFVYNPNCALRKTNTDIAGGCSPYQLFIHGKNTFGIYRVEYIWLIFKLMRNNSWHNSMTLWCISLSAAYFHFSTRKLFHCVNCAIE